MHIICEDYVPWTQWYLEIGYFFLLCYMPWWNYSSFHICYKKEKTVMCLNDLRDIHIFEIYLNVALLNGVFSNEYIYMYIQNLFVCIHVQCIYWLFEKSDVFLLMYGLLYVHLCKSRLMFLHFLLSWDQHSYWPKSKKCCLLFILRRFLLIIIFIFTIFYIYTASWIRFIYINALYWP